MNREREICDLAMMGASRWSLLRSAFFCIFRDVDGLGGSSLCEPALIWIFRYRGVRICEGQVPHENRGRSSVRPARPHSNAPPKSTIWFVLQSTLLVAINDMRSWVAGHLHDTGYSTTWSYSTTVLDSRKRRVEDRTIVADRQHK